ncbi:MAG: hypothetical protein WC058_08180 [Phycisphaeraceae bacterium]
MTPTIRHTHRRGSILVVTLIVVFALASMLLTLSHRVSVLANASANTAAARQADAIERGAEQNVLAILSQKLDSLDDLRESDFEQIRVGKGYYWIIRPDYGDSNLPRFGLVDESAKLDLNTAGYAMLQQLSGVTEPLAGSVVDWRDPDDTPTGSGSESLAYAVKIPAYAAKNAPFESVEELLLVDGMTRDLLYGQAPSIIGTTTQSGNVFGGDRYIADGLFDDFTVWNIRPNTDKNGKTRIDINDIRQRGRLRTLLRDKLGGSRGDQVANQLGNINFTDMFDMARRAAMTAAELALVEDSITTATTQQLRGRINVNAAPREVLLCLTPLTSADVDALLANRDTSARTDERSAAWVYDVLREKAVGIGNRIAGQGCQFSAEIVAASGDGRAFKRVRIVVDVSGASPRIVYRHDRTAMGWPLDPAILKQWRRGGPANGSTPVAATLGVRQ